MTGAQPGFERRVQGALDASPSRIPVILGGCGTGRTSLLLRLRERAGRGAAQYIDVERCATTPERFLKPSRRRRHSRGTARHRPPPPRVRRSTRCSPSSTPPARPAANPARSCSTKCSSCGRSRAFPGLRHVLRDLLDALAASPNRFVLTTRYVARAHRLLRDATARFEVMHLPPLSAVRRHRPARARLQRLRADGHRRPRLPWPRRAGADRRPRRRTCARSATRWLGRGGTPDPISALTALLRPDGALDHWCHFCYELRLHRARGYGALKAILDILAEEEALTLTEISQRLHRTPGLDEGLPVVARGRRPGRLAPEALQLHRPAAPAVGPSPLPARRPRPRRTSPARSSATRSRASRSPSPCPRSRTPASTRRRKSERAGASSRSTDLESFNPNPASASDLGVGNWKLGVRAYTG